MSVSNVLAGGGAVVIAALTGLAGTVYGKHTDHNDAQLELQQARLEAAAHVVAEAKEAQLAATTAQLADTQGRYENLLAELGYWRGEVTPLRKDVADLTKQLAETRLQHAKELEELRTTHAAERAQWQQENDKLSRRITQLALQVGDLEDRQKDEDHP